MHGWAARCTCCDCAQDVWHLFHRADVPHRQRIVNAALFIYQALRELSCVLLYHGAGSCRCTLGLVCPHNLTREVMGLTHFKFAPFRLRNSAVPVASRLTTLPLLIFNGSSSLQCPNACEHI